MGTHAARPAAVRRVGRARWSAGPARRAGVAALLVALALTGCTGGTPGTTRPVVAATARAVAWRPVALPAPAGAVPVVAALAACGGRRWAVGALTRGTGRAPAVWTSVGGGPWATVPVAPVSPYGEVSLLYAAACRIQGGRPVLGALGSAVGGAHGNPRTATWLAADGVLRENPAPFELYGGPRALATAGIAAGPAGWLVVGDRVPPTGPASAAVWRSADGRTYAPADVAPGRSVPDGTQTDAGDAAAGPAGWVLAGGGIPLSGPGAGRSRPLVWRERGAGWVAETLPADAAGQVDRVAPTPTGGDPSRTPTPRGGAPSPADGDPAPTPAGDDLVAAGTVGGRLAVWRRSAGRWSAPVLLGPPGAGAPRATSLVVSRGRLLVTGRDGARSAVWESRDGRRWVPLRSPRPGRSGAGTGVAVSLVGNALLAAWPGTAGALWAAPAD